MINSCHLDIGFADSSQGIINRYFDHHFPAAIAVGKQFRTDPTLKGKVPDKLNFMFQSWVVSAYQGAICNQPSSDSVKIELADDGRPAPAPTLPGDGIGLPSWASQREWDGESKRPKTGDPFECYFRPNTIKKRDNIFRYLECPLGLGLHCPNATQVADFKAAVTAGDITWHAFPHNAELETMDPALIEAGLALTWSTDDALGVPGAIC